MRTLPVPTPKVAVQIRHKLEKEDDTWAEEARKLATALLKALATEGKDNDRERQLRNIQSMAEQSNSWRALELFIRYQAARKEIPKDWAEQAIKTLEKLQENARSVLRDSPASSDPELLKAVHLELVARTLGYAVRWHVWDTKGKETRHEHV